MRLSRARVLDLDTRESCALTDDSRPHAIAASPDRAAPRWSVLVRRCERRAAPDQLPQTRCHPRSTEEPADS